MPLTRKDFLKLTGTTAAGTFLGGLSFLSSCKKAPGKLRQAKETTSICPYCGVGCGLIVSARDGKIINIEGDPDHPVNEGSLCSKGASLFQLANNNNRLKKVLYRAPGSSQWEEKSWDWTISEISKRITGTRDSNWIDKDIKGNTVNRTDAIASMGSVFLNSEEAYLYSKMLRALGIVYMENQARLCVSSGIAANGETVGRGPMTNHWIDLANSDCIMIIGSNAAETFPISFKWINKAKDSGAKIIHVDPRFTRTSANSDIYAPLRTGTDIAFIGGMINYLLNDIKKNPDKYNLEYIKEYTNASFLINPGFKFKDGLFSGYNPSKKSYSKGSWQYQLNDDGIPLMDPSLKDPRCVFSLLKKHFARYDVDTVCDITGTPRDAYIETCKTFIKTGAKGKAGAIIFSSGACEHSHGTQNVRSYGILQLLLGNIGIAGGGLNGVAGATNGLGCSLQGLLFHWFPGALPVPKAGDQNLETYLKRVTPPKSKIPNTASPWMERTKHVVSLLKAWYGENATRGNDYCFNLLPRIGGNSSYMPLLGKIESRDIKGLICWGMNPAVSGPSSEKTRKAFEKLKWMIVTDLWETETAGFWKRPGTNPAKIQTEVFLLPAALSFEKEGSTTNSSRWVQWRYQAVQPPEEAKSDLWILNRLFKEIRKHYEASGGDNAQSILNMQWDYGPDDKPDVHIVAKEINGYDTTTNTLNDSPGSLKNDGTTSAGNWIFSGSYTENGNMTARRNVTDDSGIGLYSEWAWCWPANRRIFYNRASVDLKGVPWDKKRPVIKWNKSSEKWEGDVPDGGPPPGAIYPFIMKPEGRARLFGMGPADGPLPEHYEPWESAVSNKLSSQQINPLIEIFDNKKGNSTKFPIIATTFRLVEHMHSGAVTRNVPLLVELSPHMFIEMSHELASEKGISNGDRVKIFTARGKLNAFALVTRRLQPFTVHGKTVHQIGMPWNFGYYGLVTGDSANVLTPLVADPNSMIPEFRAFLCDVKKT